MKNLKSLPKGQYLKEVKKPKEIPNGKRHLICHLITAHGMNSLNKTVLVENKKELAELQKSHSMGMYTELKWYLVSDNHLHEDKHKPKGPGM